MIKAYLAISMSCLRDERSGKTSPSGQLRPAPIALMITRSNGSRQDVLTMLMLTLEEFKDMALAFSDAMRDHSRALELLSVENVSDPKPETTIKP